MKLTKLVCPLLSMLLAVSCARSVRPAYPQDLAPGPATPSTGKCCRLGDLETHAHIAFPPIEMDVAPQCIFGETVTHIRVMGTVAACAGEITDVEYGSFTIIATTSRDACGGSGTGSRICSFTGLRYRAHTRFSPAFSCIDASEVSWDRVTGNDAVSQVACQNSTHDLLLSSLDAIFVRASVVGSSSLPDANGRLPFCPLDAFTPVARPRCDGWVQRRP
jgi:hypothetical protein